MGVVGLRLGDEVGCILIGLIASRAGLASGAVIVFRAVCLFG
jgi:hypothetical protein